MITYIYKDEIGDWPPREILIKKGSAVGMTESIESIEYYNQALKSHFKTRNSMKDQHKKIKGYRDLNKEEIDLMNVVKELSVKVGASLEVIEVSEGTDLRWCSIAKTDLQKGFMALVRSIAKPTTF